MTARHVASDRQAKTDASGRRVARGIEPYKRAERAVPIRRRDPGSVVIDHNVDPVCDLDGGKTDIGAMPVRVADQIATRPLQSIRAYRNNLVGRTGNRKRRPAVSA